MSAQRMGESESNLTKTNIAAFDQIFKLHAGSMEGGREAILKNMVKANGG